MPRDEVAFVGYYHGPKLGVGVFVDRLLSRIVPGVGWTDKITLYTNNNSAEKFIGLHPKIRVVRSIWLNSGSIPAIFFTALIFPLICKARKVRVAFLLANPIVLLPLIPIVSVIQDLNEFEVASKYGAFRTFYRKHIMLKSAVKRSARLIASSRFAAAQIKKFFPEVSEERISIVELGVEVDKVDQSAFDLLSDEKKFEENKYFLIVGRIDPAAKGLYDALDLYRQIISRNGHSNFKLILVGGINSSSKAEAEQFLNGIKNDPELSAKVHYLGFVEPGLLAALYSNATAVIFMSSFEGFGFPLIEAFRLGSPVIYNKACAVLDQHAEGAAFAISDEAVRARTLDFSAFAPLYDKEKRAALSTRMNQIAAKYDWDRCARGYLDVAHQIKGEKA